MVKAYRLLLSPLLGQNCRYTPTCSSYMIEAVEKYGAVKGTKMGLKRLSKCHPFARKHWDETAGYDPVPEEKD